MFNYINVQVLQFFSKQKLETFDISHTFLPLTVTKLSTLKNSPVFGPPCIHAHSLAWLPRSVNTTRRFTVQPTRLPEHTNTTSKPRKVLINSYSQHRNGIELNWSGLSKSTQFSYTTRSLITRVHVTTTSHLLPAAKLGQCSIRF